MIARPPIRARAQIGRRGFIALAAGAAAWPTLLRAQDGDTPVVGFLRTTPAAPFAHIAEAFRQGLEEEGFVASKNVRIEYRYADNQLDRLPGLAAELVRAKVSVIVGNSQAAEAARDATATIPIVFVSGDDPVTRGLVGNLHRPEANLTGLTFFGGGKLAGKRMELLNELLPAPGEFAILQDPNWPGSAAELPELQAMARTLGRKIAVFRAGREAEFEPALSAIASSGARALIVIGSPVFSSRRQKLAALVRRHRLPAIFDIRDHVEAGGLMSYSASFVDTYRQAGVYAGRILKGAKPRDLPVLQPTKFVLAVNLKTANALGIVVPQSILVRADEVIE